MNTGDSTYELKRSEYTSGKMIGMVFKTQEELAAGSHVGFYIPKVLPLMEHADGPADSDESIDEGVFANNGDTKPSIPSTIHICNFIKCKWNGYSNFTQPIIALGETSDIYFFDGNLRYPRYTNTYPAEKKRKTDHVEWFAYGKDNVDDIPGDYYKAVLSTRDNMIWIHTSMENGEENMYDIKIDTKGCTFEVNDDLGNHIKLETKEKRILLENESASFLEIIDKDVNLTCEGNVTITCDNYKLEAKTAIERKGGSKIEDTAPNVKISGDAKIECVTPQCEFTVSAMLKSVSPMNQFTGVCDINSTITQTAFLSNAPSSIFTGLAKATMFVIG
jgi:hypothetical protein